MKTIFIDGIKITFDRVIDFEQKGTELLECFFFNNKNLVASKFLTELALKKIKL